MSCLIIATVGANLTPSFLRQGNTIVIGSAPITNRIGYSTGQYGMANGWGFGYTNASTVLSPIGIPADVARRIDEKIDDGKPSSGKFGIIAGQTGCDNAFKSVNNLALLSAYPAPSVSCNVTAGKKID